MKARMVGAVVCALLAMGLVRAVEAQAPAVAQSHAKGDIGGDWQGTIEAGKSLRMVLRVTKVEKGYAAKFYALDEGGQVIPVSSVALDGGAVTLEIAMIGGRYEGTLSGDGTTMTGTWTRVGSKLPLSLVRATKETAWEIPAAAKGPATMAADADPSFEVATIKPNQTGGGRMQHLMLQGREFTTQNSSLGDLISFAYEVQLKQIVAGPAWMTEDRYDISALPDTPGAPSMVQLRLMIRKLLTERFKLTFHKEKREMPAYVLTVAKGGQKLQPTEVKGPIPAFGFVPAKGGLNMIAGNTSIPDFTSVLQSFVVDRPVVDQTGLAGRFDLTINFTPDDSQFNGHSPLAPKQDREKETEVPPSLAEAMQQQLGLKLEAQKTAVDVIAVDHVEKPSAN